MQTTHVQRVVKFIMRHTKGNEQLQLCSFFKWSINYIRQTFVVAMLTAIIVRNSCMQIACNWYQLKYFHLINCVNWLIRHTPSNTLCV